MFFDYEGYMQKFKHFWAKRKIDLKLNTKRLPSQLFNHSDELWTCTNLDLPQVVFICTEKSDQRATESRGEGQNHSHENGLWETLVQTLRLCVVNCHTLCMLCLTWTESKLFWTKIKQEQSLHETTVLTHAAVEMERNYFYRVRWPSPSVLTHCSVASLLALWRKFGLPRSKKNLRPPRDLNPRPPDKITSACINTSWLTHWFTQARKTVQIMQFVYEWKSDSCYLVS